LNNKIITVIFAFLLVISFVNAFDLTSTDIEKTTCQGNTLLFTANVFGSGDFNVNLEGSASSWSIAVPQSFTLVSEGETIYIYATPNSNINPGTYTLNLLVSNNQETRTIPFTINVNNCHDIRLTGEFPKSICLNDVTQFNYQIENLANFQETLELDLNGPNFLSTPQSLITLNPGETKNIQVHVDSNNQIGDYDFTLSASNQYLVSEINSNLQINSCYEFTVTSDKDFVDLCEDSQETISLTIKNTGTRSLDYSLYINAPEWANLDLNTFTLEPNQEKIVNVVLSPPYGVEGNFNIKLNINGFEKELNVGVNKCHDVFLDVIEKSVSLCNNIQTPVYIKNTGLFEKEFNLQTSEEWAELDEYNINLQPNEETNVNLIIDPQNLAIGTYDVYIRALGLDSSAVSSEDKVKVNILDDQNCYLTTISAKDLSVNQDSSATLPITITNNANEKILYQVSLTGNAAPFVQLNPSIIEIEPRSSETIYLYVAPSLDINPGGYSANIDVSFNNNILASKSIDVNIKEAKVSKLGEITFFKQIENFFVSLWNSIFPPSTIGEVQEIEGDEETEEESPEENDEEDVDEETEENMEEDSEGEINGTITEESEVEESNFVNDIYEKAKNYWIYILIVIIIIIVALIALFFKSSKEDDEIDFDEDFDDLEDDDFDDEETEPLKIGRWIIGVIAILTIIWTQIQYDWFGYLKTYSVEYATLIWDYATIYKVYLLMGLIGLLIIILIIKYWKAIVDFFEEDEEEKPKPKRKKKKKK